MHHHNYLLIILVLCATPLTAMESKSMIGESTKCDHLNEKEIRALEVREEKKILRLEDGEVELLTSMAIRCSTGNSVLKLLNQGADIRRADKNGNTMLHYAVKGGFDDIIPLLLERGADINQPNNRGETPLMMAIENKNYAAAERLIQNGADVNLMANSGSTPLHCAVYGGFEGLIKLLLEKGADPLVQGTTSNETPAEIAWRMGERALAMKIESFIEEKYSQKVLKGRGYVARHPSHWNPITF